MMATTSAGTRAFHEDGATIVGQHPHPMAAGTTNAVTGNKTPPAEADALPTQTFMVGSMKVQVGGRVAEINHVYTAQPDGDTWVIFADANVLVTGDVYGRPRRLSNCLHCCDAQAMSELGQSRHLARP